MPQKKFLLFIFAIATLIVTMFFPISKSSAADKINATISLTPNFTIEKKDTVTIQIYKMINGNKSINSSGGVRFSLDVTDNKQYSGYESQPITLTPNVSYVITIEDSSKYALGGHSSIEFKTGDQDLSLEYTLEKVSTTSTTPSPTESAATPAGGTTPSPTSTETNAAGTSGSSDFSAKPITITLPTYGPATWPALGKNIMDFMGWIAGIIFVGVLLIGAIIYITAGSNEQGAETGKKAIYGAIIGIAITALAWTIVTFVANTIK